MKARKRGTILSAEQALSAHKPNTSLGASIRAEFAKRGWKVGDVARMLGVESARVSNAINNSYGISRSGRKTRRYGIEDDIAKLLGFNPFPPREIPRQASTPLGVELQSITRRSLVEIEKQFGLPNGSIRDVCFGRRSERAEPVIERLVGRKIYDAPAIRKLSKKNALLREIQSKGWTLKAVADEVGCTGEGVRQVLQSRKGGERITAKLREILGYDPFLPPTPRPTQYRHSAKFEQERGYREVRRRTGKSISP